MEAMLYKSEGCDCTCHLHRAIYSASGEPQFGRRSNSVDGATFSNGMVDTTADESGETEGMYLEM